MYDKATNQEQNLGGPLIPYHWCYMCPLFWKKKLLLSFTEIEGTLEKEEDNYWCQMEWETKRKTEVKME